MRKTRSAKPARKPLSRGAIVRAVASSTAIETGQSVAKLQRKLEAPSGRFRDIELAKP